jgi:leucyl/phenylalanyl-tRNA--protein transferase
MLKKKNLLEPENMIMLYAQGAFPMADEKGEIDWYFPEIRTIIPVDSFNYPRSLKKFLASADFEFKFDTCTMEVVKNCANREETWISDELIIAYEKLRKAGYLHSVEVFQDNQLVGGLYGVTFGAAFFGESMFSKVSQASKSALIKLLFRLREKKFILLDVQYMTEHLKMFGAKEIPLEEYQAILDEAYKYVPDFS